MCTLRFLFLVASISQISDDSWIPIFINDSLDLLISKFLGLFGILVVTALQGVNPMTDLNESDGIYSRETSFQGVKVLHLLWNLKFPGALSVSSPVFTPILTVYLDFIYRKVLVTYSWSMFVENSGHTSKLHIYIHTTLHTAALSAHTAACGSYRDPSSGLIFFYSVNFRVLDMRNVI